MKSLGADIAIDYRTQNWTDLVSDGSVDFVYDTVGAKGTGDQVVPKLKSGGYFVTLEAAGAKRSRTSRQYTSIDAFLPSLAGIRSPRAVVSRCCVFFYRTRIAGSERAPAKPSVYFGVC